MGSFANLSAKLNLNIQDFSNKMQAASGQVNKFAAHINGKTVAAMKELNEETFAWGLNMKSASRVVSGILISQAFYSMLRSVREATSAVWEFTKQLEYAHIAYSNLFNSTSLATEFINVLKDFAAKTPFSFTEAEAAAKRLLAYGIEYKNVMYVMQGVMSAASIQGDASKIEAISRAFGQIYTYGKLMTQEVRQLSEAGIPAYEILQEELGLTQEQLRNLGKEAIPASVAINALVDGIQKRFGNVTKASALTLQGIISNIRDNATMLFAGLFEPMTKVLKAAFAALGNFLYNLREIFELKGAGGVFESLFPKELHGVLRQFAANLLAVLQALLRVAHAAGSIMKPVMLAFVRVFNAVAPVLTGVANVLSEMIGVLTSNAKAMSILTAALASAAAMWVVFKVKAIATAVVTKVIMAISGAISILSSALTFVVAHPFWTLMIGLGAVLVGVSTGFGELGTKVNDFFKKMTQFNNIDADKLLLPSQKERANDLDKFNQKLEGTSDAMDDLSDSTNKASKSLLSFDEVFRLKEPDEGTESGIDFSGVLDSLDSYTPADISFDNYFSALKGGFLDKLKKAFDEMKGPISDIISIAVGAAFGKVAGKLLGGALGGTLGMIAGGIAGYFWDKLADAFNLDPEQRTQASMIGGISAGIGLVLGAALGGPMGAKIGLAIGGFVGSFWGLFAEYLGVAPEQHLATVISGVITGAITASFSFIKSFVSNLAMVSGYIGIMGTFTHTLKTSLTGALKAGVKGAIASLAGGILSNAIAGWIAKELDLTAEDLENAGAGQSIGNIIGSITGLMLGGPMGSIIGGVLGQLSGSIIGEFWNYMGSTLQSSIIGGAAGLPTGALVGTIVGALGGPIGAGLGAAIGTGIGAVTGVIVDKWDEIAKFFKNVGKTVVKAAKNVFDAVLKVFKPLADAVIAIVEPIWDAIKPLFDFIASVIGDIFSAVMTVLGDLLGAIFKVCKDILGFVGKVLGDIAHAIFEVGKDILGVVSDILGAIFSVVWDVLSGIVSFVTDTLGGILSTVTSILGSILGVVSDILGRIFGVVGDVLGGIVNFVVGALQSIYDVVKSVLGAVYDVVKGVFSFMYDTISSIVGGIYNVISSVFSGIYNTIKSVVGSIGDAVGGTFKGIYDAVSGTMSSMYNTVKDGLSSMLSAFKDWASNLWDSTLGKVFGWLDSGIDKLKEFFGLSEKAVEVVEPVRVASMKAHDMVSSGTVMSSRASVNEKYKYRPVASNGPLVTTGHALGGVFNREHIARFNEDNKAEAIIPLEVESAMQPFVDAVSNGLTATLAPMLAGAGGSQMQPLYVGTLIADDRSLKELERRMEVIRIQEKRR